VDNKLNQEGFTLIEVLVMTVLLAMAFLVFLGSLNLGRDLQNKSEIKSVQSILLHDLQEQIKSRRFDENLIASWSADLGADTQENSLSDFDDVDDFKNYQIAPYADHPAFGAQVHVDYVNRATKFRVVSATPTEYKRVVVNISHSSFSTLIDTLIIGAGL
jgi:type II secretory pathway pseudopilin PulG